MNFYLQQIINACGTATFVMFCGCMMYYVPKLFTELYLELVNKHKHNRRSRDLCYERELIKSKGYKSHYDELWEKADKEKAYGILGDVGKND